MRHVRRPSTIRSWALLTVILAPFLGCASADYSGSKLYEQARNEANSGNAEAAMATLKKGVSSYPDNPRIRLELARLQIEKGEAHHLQERELMRTYGSLLEADQVTEARASLAEAEAQRAKALPWYTAARDHLDLAIQIEEEPEFVAWSSELATKVAVFFEDWKAAYDHLTEAIELGKPTGERLARWREFQAALRQKVGPDH